MTPDGEAFYELAKKLRALGAVKVEQTPGGFACVWGTVPKRSLVKPEPAVPTPAVDPMATTERPPRSKKEQKKIAMTAEQEALEQLAKELA